MNLWKTLNTANNFARDWYGELTNQCSHVLLGMLASFLIVAGFMFAFDDAPYRGLVFLFVLLAYALVIEYRVQGWRAGDSWFDTSMVGFGAAAVLLPFEAKALSWPMLDLQMNVHLLLWIATAWAIMLGARVGKRYVDAS